MIVALLFLILFALLFPKALKFLLALMFIGGIMLLGEVHASPNLPLNAAEKWCSTHPDSRESGDADEHLISIQDCATRIAKTETNVKPNSWISYWHSLDEQCRGGSGDTAKTNQACDKRLAIDKILKDRGCRFRYPGGWPELKGEYWNCS